MFKNALSPLYLLNGWVDVYQTGTDKSVGDGKELVRFW